MKQSQTATILIVEGEVRVRMPLATYLRECGYRVIECHNGDDALQILGSSEIRVDVVLTNPIRGQGKSGFDLAKWVRENKPDIEVVFSGTPQRAAAIAGDLCAEGPEPPSSHPQRLEEEIRRLLAGRSK